MADAQIPAGGSPVPDLTLVWSQAPDFTADLVTGGSGSGSAIEGMGFEITLNTLQNAEQTMITQAAPIVTAYEDLKYLFQSTKDYIFGQQATDTTTTLMNPSVTEGDDPITSTGPDPIAKPATEFANGTDGKPGMNAVEEYALQQIGNAMAALGQFIVLLNNCGANYAQADRNSFFPPPPKPSGGSTDS